MKGNRPLQEIVSFPPGTVQEEYLIEFGDKKGALNMGACKGQPNFDGNPRVDYYKESDGLSSLHLAVKGRQMEVSKLLLDSGADPNGRDKRGRSPLHIAVLEDDGGIVSILLEHGAKVDARDEEGGTPLHYAKSEQMVCLLVKKGACLWTKNTHQMAPITTIPLEVFTTCLDSCITKAKCSKFIYIDFSILNAGDERGDEWKHLGAMVEASGNKILLNHPLISTFLLIKWGRVLPFFVALFLLNLTYVISFTCYAVAMIPSDVCHANCTKTITEPHPVTRYAFFAMLGISLTVEAGQMMGSSKFLEHFLNPGVVFGIFIKVLAACSSCTVVPEDVRKGLAIISLSLSWLNMGWMFGGFPMFHKYIAMFTTVCLNYVSFFVPFTFPLFGFLLSFYLSYNWSNEDNSRWYQGLYQEFPLASLKTFVMMHGSVDLVDLPFGQFTPYTLLLMMLFQFFVTVVIMNLLNAMAVSDTKAIANEAEIMGLRASAMYISRMENFLQRIGPRSSSPLFPAWKRFVDNNHLFSTLPNGQLTIFVEDGRAYSTQQQSVTRFPKEVVDTLMAAATYRESTEVPSTPPLPTSCLQDDENDHLHKLVIAELKHLKLSQATLQKQVDRIYTLVKDMPWQRSTKYRE